MFSKEYDISDQTMRDRLWDSDGYDIQTLFEDADQYFDPNAVHYDLDAGKKVKGVPGTQEEEPPKPQPQPVLGQDEKSPVKPQPTSSTQTSNSAQPSIATPSTTKPTNSTATTASPTTTPSTSSTPTTAPPKTTVPTSSTATT